MENHYHFCSMPKHVDRKRCLWLEGTKTRKKFLCDFLYFLYCMIMHCRGSGKLFYHNYSSLASFFFWRNFCFFRNSKNFHLHLSSQVEMIFNLKRNIVAPRPCWISTSMITFRTRACTDFAPFSLAQNKEIFQIIMPDRVSFRVKKFSLVFL